MNTPRDAGRVVIVGGGLAGFSAAQQLRTLGHVGPITVIESEPTSYDRPPLSKRLFEEGFDLDSLAFWTTDRFTEQRIDTRFGVKATHLDPEAGSVELEDGSILSADTVLLAVGGQARRLPIPGADLPGVHVLRTFADAQNIRHRADPGTRAVVIGAGLIGAELASALVTHGVRVTIVDPVTLPLVPAVGEQLATHLHAMHAAHGTEVVVGVTAAIVQDSDQLRVEVDGGPSLPADVVVVGIGLTPLTELAADAGITVDDGIIVDAFYRTSAERVYAAGDVARRRGADGVLERREEHWEAAQLSGQHAAYGMLGIEPPARGSSWFWSDRYGVHVEATGRLTGSGEIVARQGTETSAVFLVDEGRLVGAAAVDDTNLIRAARRLIDQRIPVNAAELADPAIQLRALLRAAR